MRSRRLAQVRSGAGASGGQAPPSGAAVAPDVLGFDRAAAGDVAMRPCEHRAGDDGGIDRTIARRQREPASGRASARPTRSPSRISVRGPRAATAGTRSTVANGSAPSAASSSPLTRCVEDFGARVRAERRHDEAARRAGGQRHPGEGHRQLEIDGAERGLRTGQPSSSCRGSRSSRRRRAARSRRRSAKSTTASCSLGCGSDSGRRVSATTLPTSGSSSRQESSRRPTSPVAPAIRTLRPMARFRSGASTR